MTNAGCAFEDAIELAQGCLNYTNHTLLPEALERWSRRPDGPRFCRAIMQIIERIDDAHARQYPSRHGVGAASMAR